MRRPPRPGDARGPVDRVRLEREHERKQRQERERKEKEERDRKEQEDRERKEKEERERKEKEERDRKEQEERSATDRACRAHLDFLRKHCPQLLPGAPLPPGRTSDPLPVDPAQATVLVATAAREAAAAGTGAGPDDLPRAVVWTSGADALLVLLETLRVRTDDGVVTVSVEVACDELAQAGSSPRAEVLVHLVVGTRERPTGLLAAAPRPEGPALVVDRWGDALVALAWQALLDASAGLAAVVGRDADGAGLVPTSWSATSKGLSVAPQARHAVDRQRATAVLR